ncbi:Fructoselysine 3-epimerase [Planctomycetaceae bacterium]|nr:Fructoselysine 3-epimerase [Planctomycetaceae bacterium]
MRFSFSTNAFIRHTVYKAIESIAAAGYEGVELLADIPHIYVHTLRSSDIRKLKATLTANRIAVSNINANTVRGYYGNGSGEPLFEPCLTDPDPDVRQWRIEYTKKCIDLAKTLDCRNVSVTSGPIQPESTPEEGVESLKKALREIIRHAEATGVRVGLEYEPGLLIESGSELSCLLGEIGSEFLGANLDLGHSHVLGEDPEFTVRLLKDKIFHVHLEDIKDRRHYHLIPGTGDMDFKMLLSLFEKTYNGFITVELYTYPDKPEEAARKSLEFLKGLAARRTVTDAVN